MRPRPVVVHDPLFGHRTLRDPSPQGGSGRGRKVGVHSGVVLVSGLRVGYPVRWDGVSFVWTFSEVNDK